MIRNSAFTLAEAISVLVLLGVVFAITVPSAINNANIKSRQLKLKKAVADYQKLVENLVVTNDIPRTTASFNAELLKDNCTLIRQNYKVASTIGDSGCKFLSVNEIYWDFTNPSEPIVAFNPDYFNESNAKSENNTAFIMSTKFTSDGSIRVNDLGYEKGLGKSDSYWNIAKIDCFTNNKTCKKVYYIKKVEEKKD